MTTTTSNPYRLSRNVLPTHYALTLEPDLDAATFSGSVDITLDVAESTTEIILNTAELEIQLAVFDGAPAAIIFDEENERATIFLSSQALPGSAKLHLEFTGILNDKLRGFYRSRFTDDDGVEHNIATTQFESTDARRAFPCFDEPDFKATFGVTLIVPQGEFAVSNGPETSSETREDGKRVVAFADTMKMSTYLVAFIVGPFEATDPVDVDGVPLRIVHPIGKGHLAAYALEVGEFCLRHFSKYYDIPYPDKKVDLVAVPDFAAGAMENVGCITFREVLLLLDREKVTQGELTRVADVIAHELAHMWFGDLVTMRWWNGIWLNEAFATFMATAAVDAFQPKWQRWVQFGLERSAAFDIDSLDSTRPIEYPVESPQDAEGMFDLLTYEKGGSVLRQLEQYLGEEGFRDGIRHYLKKHSYGNTETGDLWDAIEEVTGQPARRIMDSWIFQRGFPIVNVNLSDDRRTVTLSQRRFLFTATEEPENEDKTLWSVPLVIKIRSAGGETVRRELLENRSVEIALDAAADSVLVNAGGDGFYRVEYSAGLLDSLVSSMADNLTAIERYGLVDDTWSSVMTGGTTSPEFLAFASGFKDETDPDVWSSLTGALTQLSRLLDDEPLERFRAYIRNLAGPAHRRLGWEASPGESERDLELRGLLIRTMGISGDDAATRTTAGEMHDRYLEDASSIEPNVAAAVASVVANKGGDADYETFLGRFKSPITPQEETRYMYALAGFPDRSQIDRTLAMTLNDEIRTQNAPFVIASCMMNRDHGVAGWEHIKANWDEINEKYPRNTIVRMLSGIKALSKPELAADVEAFFKDHDVPQGRLMLEQHLEKLRVNVALREREAKRLADAV
ncbi:MAG: M1 family metallopeptidase [Chloroflexi bacterium]|nr:M1 family metallopeptidase [Chloroflexota bacterium]